MPRGEDTKLVLSYRVSIRYEREGGGTHLAGGIDNVEIEFLSLVFHDFLERILYRGIVRVDEMGVDELHGEGRLSYVVSSRVSFLCNFERIRLRDDTAR